MAPNACGFSKVGRTGSPQGGPTSGSSPSVLRLRRAAWSWSRWRDVVARPPRFLVRHGPRHRVVAWPARGLRPLRWLHLRGQAKGIVGSSYSEACHASPCNPPDGSSTLPSRKPCFKPRTPPALSFLFRVATGLVALAGAACCTAPWRTQSNGPALATRKRRKGGSCLAWRGRRQRLCWMCRLLDAQPPMGWRLTAVEPPVVVSPQAD